MTILKRMKRRLTDAYRNLKRQAQYLWQRLVTEPGYAEATAAFVMSAGAFWCRNTALVRLMREIAQALAALIRASIREYHDRSGHMPELDPGWTD